MSQLQVMGGGIKSQTCYNIAFRIWDFCTKNQLRVSAAHIPGAINIEADKQSRVLEYATDSDVNIRANFVGSFSACHQVRPRGRFSNLRFGATLTFKLTAGF